MIVNKEEILHIAKLADLNIQENEIQEYTKNLQDILNFVQILNNVDTQNIEESIGIINSSNVFRKDEIKEFGERQSLLQNAPEQEKNMFKIPKVI
ncbi:MAG: Asp-tRNA(Asn)/Glu-tRNA(Gln) amidotransferase subunit GatC [Clostridia bacterium]|nr:Asp-tRNA(Asn)/Glu-tRNA(Gln) amidotransferase subunit GatC [Clostridia bacterium]